MTIKNFTPPKNFRRGAYNFWPSEMPDVRPASDFTLEEAKQLVDNYVLVLGPVERGISKLDWPYKDICLLRECNAEGWPFWQMRNERVMITRFR